MLGLRLELVRLLRGAIELLSSNFPVAIKDFDEVIALEPDNSQAYTDRGLAKPGLRDFAGAVANFSEAIRLNPNDSDALKYRGVVRTLLRNWEGAFADFNQALNLNQDDPEIYRDRAGLQVMRKEFKRAVADATEAIRLNGKDSVSYRFRGLGRMRLKDFTNALADFDEAIAWDRAGCLISVKRAEYRRDFFDDGTQTRIAPGQFGIQSGVRAFRAFQDIFHLRFMFGKAFGVRVARVAPVAEQTFAAGRNTPEKPAIFQLGIFLKVNAVYEHGNKLADLFQPSKPMSLAQSAWARSRGWLRFSFGASKSAGAGTMSRNRPKDRCVARCSQPAGNSRNTVSGMRLTCQPWVCSNSLPISAS